jgi:predicted nuclease of predicted toxin-antitoxin system
MRFLANENFPLASIRLLREAGHDVLAVIQDSPGAKDPAVLAQADQEDRILLTFDRDYGELVYLRDFPVPPGIVYLRFIPESASEPAAILTGLLELPGLSLSGSFTVLERTRVRQRPLPPRSPR